MLAKVDLRDWGGILNFQFLHIAMEQDCVSLLGIVVDKKAFRNNWFSTETSISTLAEFGKIYRKTWYLIFKSL